MMLCIAAYIVKNSFKSTVLILIIQQVAIPAVFIQNERLLLIVLALAMVGVLYIFVMFWKGMDKGSFALFYSQENLLKRDRIIRYVSLITMHFSFAMIFFLFESVVGYIIGTLFIVLFAIESIFFFKTEKEN